MRVIGPHAGPRAGLSGGKSDEGEVEGHGSDRRRDDGAVTPLGDREAGDGKFGADESGGGEDHAGGSPGRGGGGGARQRGE